MRERFEERRETYYKGKEKFQKSDVSEEEKLEMEKWYEIQEYMDKGEKSREKANLDKALEHFQESLEISEEIGYKRIKATSLINIGDVYRMKGELDKAPEYLQESLDISEERVHKTDKGYLSQQ